MNSTFSVHGEIIGYKPGKTWTFDFCDPIISLDQPDMARKLECPPEKGRALMVFEGYTPWIDIPAVSRLLSREICRLMYTRANGIGDLKRRHPEERQSSVRKWNIVWKEEMMIRVIKVSAHLKKIETDLVPYTILSRRFWPLRCLCF